MSERQPVGTTRGRRGPARRSAVLPAGPGPADAGHAPGRLTMVGTRGASAPGSRGRTTGSRRYSRWARIRAGGGRWSTRSTPSRRTACSTRDRHRDGGAACTIGTGARSSGSIQARTCCGWRAPWRRVRGGRRRSGGEPAVRGCGVRAPDVHVSPALRRRSGGDDARAGAGRKAGRPVAMVEFGVPGGVWRPPWWLYTRIGLPLGGRVVSARWFAVGAFVGPSIERLYARHPVAAVERYWREAGLGDVRTRRMSLGGGVVMRATRRSSAETRPEPPRTPAGAAFSPAFYAAREGGWRDYWTLLHPPYTVWHLSSCSSVQRSRPLPTRGSSPARWSRSGSRSGSAPTRWWAQGPPAADPDPIGGARRARHGGAAGRGRTRPGRGDDARTSLPRVRRRWRGDRHPVCVRGTAGAHGPRLCDRVGRIPGRHRRLCDGRASGADGARGAGGAAAEPRPAATVHARALDPPPGRRGERRDHVRGRLARTDRRAHAHQRPEAALSILWLATFAGALGVLLAHWL